MAEPQPSEESISSLLEMTGLEPVHDRHIVTAALRRAMRQTPGAAQDTIVTMVLDEFFQDPQKFRSAYDWDETVWGADRDGGQQNNFDPWSYHIESVDHHMEGTTPPGSFLAPSRPPSRVNNRSPAPPPALGWGDGAPKSKAEEDAQLLQALQASEASIESRVRFSDQDTHYGLAGSNDPPSYHASSPYHPSQQQQNFQPTTKPISDYDMQQWSMVSSWGAVNTVSAGTAAPSLRKRDDDAPAFLVQGDESWGVDRLGGLVTILHSIPLARNVLLSLDDSAGSYGHNQNWWKGGEIVDEGRWDSIDLPHEIHRLMAFLDDTDRSYGTVNPLNKSIFQFPAEEESKGVEPRLYDLLSRLHRSIVGPLLHEAKPVSIDGAPCDEESTVFGYTVFEGPEAVVHTGMLEEVWDRTMWHQTLNPKAELWDADLQTSILASMGEVMAIEIRQPPSVPLEIPLVWYPERYLESRREEAAEIQKLWWWTNRRMAELEAKENRFCRWTNPQGTPFRMLDICNATLEQLKVRIALIEGRARWRAFIESDWDDAKDPEAPNISDTPCALTEEEQDKMRNLERDVKWCEGKIAAASQWQEYISRERKVVADLQRIMAKALTDPSLPRPKPMTGPVFHLRGVATARDTIYLCKRRTDALVDIEGSPHEQWWRLAFNTDNPAKPVCAEKIDVERVLQDMWQESGTCVAIYATETAMGADSLPLSSALRQFVKADNKLFHHELAQEIQDQEQAEAAATTMTSLSNLPLSNGVDLTSFLESPSKRRRTSLGSMDSMSSNRAFVSDSDSGSEVGNRGRGINPLMMHHDNSSTAMLVSFDGGGGDLLDDAMAMEMEDIASPRPTNRPAVTVTTYTPDASEGAESPVLGRPTTTEAATATAFDMVFEEWTLPPGAETKPNTAEEAYEVGVEDANAGAGMAGSEHGQRQADAEEAEAADGKMPEMREKEGGIPFFAAHATATRPAESGVDIVAEESVKSDAEEIVETDGVGGDGAVGSTVESAVGSTVESTAGSTAV